MRFTLQSFDPFLHWMTLVILCIMPLLIGYVLYKLGSLPGAIARERGHPQAAAIGICGWMGVVTLVLWPVAMVWAHLSPARLGEINADRTSELLARMQRASKLLAQIETLASGQSTKVTGG